jgi:hypothetical protein
MVKIILFILLCSLCFKVNSQSNSMLESKLYDLHLDINTLYNIPTFNSVYKENKILDERLLKSKMKLVIHAKLQMQFLVSSNALLNAVGVLKIDSVEMPEKYKFLLSFLEKPFKLFYSKQQLIESVVFSDNMPIEARQIMNHFLSYMQFPILKKNEIEIVEEDRNGFFTSNYIKDKRNKKWLKKSLGYKLNRNNPLTEHLQALNGEVFSVNSLFFDSLKMHEKLSTSFNNELTNITITNFICKSLKNEWIQKYFTSLDSLKYSRNDNKYTLSNFITEKESQTQMSKSLLREETYFDLCIMIEKYKLTNTKIDSLYLYDKLAALFYLQPTYIDTAIYFLSKTNNKSLGHQIFLKALCKVSTSKALNAVATIISKSKQDIPYIYFIYESLLFTKHPTGSLYDTVFKIAFENVQNEIAKPMRYLCSSLLFNIKKDDVNLAKHLLSELVNQSYFKVNEEELLVILGNVGLETSENIIDKYVKNKNKDIRTKAYLAFRNILNDNVCNKLLYALSIEKEKEVLSSIIYSLQYQNFHQKIINKCLHSFRYMKDETNQIDFIKLIRLHGSKLIGVEAFLLSIENGNYGQKVKAVAQKR